MINQLLIKTSSYQYVNLAFYFFIECNVVCSKDATDGKEGDWSFQKCDCRLSDSCKNKPPAWSNILDAILLQNHEHSCTCLVFYQQLSLDFKSTGHIL